MITYKFKYSNIEGLTRLDPEYYQPKYALKVNLIRNLNSKRLSKIFDISLGPAYPSSEITKNGELPIAKIGDVTNKRKPEDWDSLSSIAYNKFGSANIIKNDILITLTGDPPDVGKVHMPYTEFDLQEKVLAFNQRVGRLRTKELSPFFLYAALSSEYFRVRFEQCALGIRQRNVCIPDLKNAMVFLPDEEIIESISVKVKEHFKLSCLSKDLYTQATQLLNEALGLNDIQFKKEKSYNASFSEVITNNRADAEFYDTKYNSYLEKVNVFEAGTVPLLQCCERVMPNYNPKTERLNEIFYIEIGDISIADGAFQFKKIKTKEAPANAKIALKGGEILLSMVRPTRGAITIVPDYLPEGRVVCSGAFYVFNPKSPAHREIIWLYLRLLKNCFEKYCGGTSYPTIEPKYISFFPIPQFDMVLANEIRKLIMDSADARNKSELLLEQAKNEVEALIEKAARKP